jgi:hypothetical protein
MLTHRNLIGNAHLVRPGTLSAPDTVTDVAGGVGKLLKRELRAPYWQGRETMLAAA